MEKDARLWALEALTVNLLVIVAGFLVDRDAVLNMTFEQLMEAAKLQAAGSDVLLQDLQAAVHRLMAMTDARMAGPSAV